MNEIEGCVPRESSFHVWCHVCLNKPILSPHAKFDGVVVTQAASLGKRLFQFVGRYPRVRAGWEFLCCIPLTICGLVRRVSACPLPDPVPCVGAVSAGSDPDLTRFTRAGFREFAALQQGKIPAGAFAAEISAAASVALAVSMSFSGIICRIYASDALSGGYHFRQ
jgi:hypothetical protein